MWIIAILDHDHFWIDLPHRQRSTGGSPQAAVQMLAPARGGSPQADIATGGSPQADRLPEVQPPAPCPSEAQPPAQADSRRRSMVGGRAEQIYTEAY